MSAAMLGGTRGKESNVGRPDKEEGTEGEEEAAAEEELEEVAAFPEP